ncbi:MAG: ABC transporter permease [Deltaproteobacteria bacterium]|nr:ABC transporter permease [Deltaproteobacteria bacterium]
MRILLQVIVKEFLQLRRDRKILPMIFIAPAIQLVLFGYAANLDVSGIPLLLVDQDRTAASRELAERFTGSGYFVLAGYEDGTAAVERWLVDGRAQVALVIAPGFGKETAAGRSPRVQLIADGSDSNSAVVGLGYASRIISEKSGVLIRNRIGNLAGPGAMSRLAAVELVPRTWYNPDLKSRWFYVPAILAMVIMVMTMVMASMGVVREKEIGTMEQVIVTPIRSWQLIVGKLFPFAVIGIVDLLLVTSIAVWHFRVPLRGSFILLVLLTCLFLLTTLGLGLLVSTLVRTQQQAMMASGFLLMTPMVYLSGLLFPIENMPAAIQYVTYAVPLRYYATVIRGIFLKGSGIGVLWPEALAMAGFGVSLLTIASLRFRKRLD